MKTLQDEQVVFVSCTTYGAHTRKAPRMRGLKAVVAVDNITSNLFVMNNLAPQVKPI